MATAQPVKSLAPIDAAYIAGLIDGEGTITLARKHRNKTASSPSVLAALRKICWNLS